MAQNALWTWTIEKIILVNYKTMLFQPHSGIHQIKDIVMELCHIQLGFWEKIVGSVSRFNTIGKCWEHHMFLWGELLDNTNGQVLEKDRHSKHNN